MYDGRGCKVCLMFSIFRIFINLSLVGTVQEQTLSFCFFNNSTTTNDRGLVCLPEENSVSAVIHRKTPLFKLIIIANHQAVTSVLAFFAIILQKLTKKMFYEEGYKIQCCLQSSAVLFLVLLRHQSTLHTVVKYKSVLIMYSHY